MSLKQSSVLTVSIVSCLYYSLMFSCSNSENPFSNPFGITGKYHLPSKINSHKLVKTRRAESWQNQKVQEKTQRKNRKKPPRKRNRQNRRKKRPAKIIFSECRQHSKVRQVENHWCCYDEPLILQTL